MDFYQKFLFVWFLIIGFHYPGYSTPLMITDTMPSALTDTIVPFPSQRAEFPGGQSGWVNYMMPVLHKRFEEFKDEDFDTCVVKILIDKEGKPLDVQPIKSKSHLLYEITKEAILNGPNWEAAEKNGEKVMAYREQTLILKKPISTQD